MALVTTWGTGSMWLLAARDAVAELGRAGLIPDRSARTNRSYQVQQTVISGLEIRIDEKLATEKTPQRLRKSSLSRFRPSSMDHIQPCDILHGIGIDPSFGHACHILEERVHS
jgi:hypothetical protein